MGQIKVTKNGPYLVSGKVPLIQETVVCDGEENPIRFEKNKEFPLQESYALCRCGHSKNPPFCDGSHHAINFDGTETANHTPYKEKAEIIEGPDLNLADCQELCASARFCHRGGGTWNLTEKSDDPKARKLAIEEAGLCPSGRLVALDKKTGEALEPEFKEEISVIEDPEAGVSGPLRVKGGIPIESADGFIYEKRNRVTLCRCGASKNKPFCDSSHIEVGFNDKLVK